MAHQHSLTHSLTGPLDQLWVVGLSIHHVLWRQSIRRLPSSRYRASHGGTTCFWEATLSLPHRSSVDPTSRWCVYAQMKRCNGRDSIRKPTNNASRRLWKCVVMLSSRVWSTTSAFGDEAISLYPKNAALAGHVEGLDLLPIGLQHCPCFCTI